MSGNCSLEHPRIDLTEPTKQEKDLIKELIDNLKYPTLTVDEIVYGQKFIAVRADTQIGLASTLGAKPSGPDLEDIKAAIGRPLSQTADFLYSPSPFMISIGLASLNAGTTIDEVETGIGAAELILEKGAGQNVVIVGDFPFINDLQSKVGRLDILELKDLSQAVPTDQWERVLQNCQVAAITSTALLTRYMTYFLKYTQAAYTILLGPSTPMSSVFYQWGASALAGSKVKKTREVFEGIKKDMGFRQLKSLGIDFVLSRKDNVQGISQKQ